MEKNGIKKRLKEGNAVGQKGLWSILVLLLLLVTATVSVLGSRLGNLSSDDSEVIALVPSAQEQAKVMAEPKAESYTGRMESRRMSAESAGTSYVSFQAEDDRQVWDSRTDVEIFHMSYNNENEVVTVNSENGDGLLAPGTENEYSFRLKNTGNTPLDYTLEVEAYITPEETALPVEVKMKSYAGDYLVGGKQSWDPVTELDGVRDQASLAANQYASYTLEWQWPFEAGQDESDTILGNQAVEEEISLTVVIHTTASQDPDAPGAAGTEPGNTDSRKPGGEPKTGDAAKYGIYIGILLISAAVLLFLLAGKKKSNAKDR